jgi:hypothetical protein
MWTLAMNIMEDHVKEEVMVMYEVFAHIGTHTHTHTRCDKLVSFLMLPVPC